MFWSEIFPRTFYGLNFQCSTIRATWTTTKPTQFIQTTFHLRDIWFLAVQENKTECKGTVIENGYVITHCYFNTIILIGSEILRVDLNVQTGIRIYDLSGLADEQVTLLLWRHLYLIAEQLVQCLCEWYCSTKLSRIVESD